MSSFTNPKTVSEGFLKALQKVHESAIEPNPEKLFNENLVTLHDGSQTTVPAAQMASQMHLDNAEKMAKSHNHTMAQHHWQQHAHIQKALERHHMELDARNQRTAAAYPAGGHQSSTVPATDGIVAQIPPMRNVKESAAAMPAAVGDGSQANAIIVGNGKEKNPATGQVIPPGMSPKKQLNQTGKNPQITNRR